MNDRIARRPRVREKRLAFRLGSTAMMFASGLAAGSVAASPIANSTRVETAPDIDGQLDDVIWQSATPIDDFREVEPGDGSAPSERTEVRILHDADNLYIAFRCFDSDASGIRASQMKRDGDLSADDRVRVIIDPYFDQRSGFYFEMNPRGARGDALVENVENLRFDWDGLWYGASSIDDGGWSCEMRIPFRTISFDPNAPSWGINFARRIRRKSERVRWASARRAIPYRSLADAGTLNGIDAVNQGLGIDVRPFATAAWRRDRDGSTDLDSDAGVDLFYKPIPTLTLALTTNTDFAETEVDERRVNLTRFPLFFPEKRDFFLQDAGIFDFGRIRRNPLPFFSRRIGIREGQPQDILVGAKLTGRVEDWNIGVLGVRLRDGESPGLDSSFVTRISRNVLEQSTIGVIITDSDPDGDGRNRLGGLDFNFRANPDPETVLTGAAWVQHSDTAGPTGSDWAAGFTFGGEDDNVDWRVGATEIGENFDAALGFVPRPGIREYFGFSEYRWRPNANGIRDYGVSANAFITTDLDDRVESTDLNSQAFLVFDSDDELTVRVSREREQLFTPFDIADGVRIETGDYEFTRYGVEYRTSSSRQAEFGAEFEGGDFYDGRRFEYSLDGGWRVSPMLTLGAEFELNDVDLPGGSFITRVIRTRVNVQFSPQLTWSTFAQFDNVSDSIGVNSRVRWEIEPGNELFVVLDQRIDRIDDRFTRGDTRLTTKLGWTLRF